MESDVDIDNDITKPGKIEDTFTCTFKEEDLDLPAGVKVLSWFFKWEGSNRLCNWPYCKKVLISVQFFIDISIIVF